MTDAEKRAAAKQFYEDWKGKGDEKQETQRFWMALLSKVFGVAEPDKLIEFELPVKIDRTSFVDGYIASTEVLIEQKSADIDLRKGYKQSDGSILSPYQQARRYAGNMTYDQRVRWIIVCNFKEFHIHDLKRPHDAPEVLLLSDLPKEYHRLNFLVDTQDENIRREMELSIQAGELVGKLYDALLKQYRDPESPETLKSLNELCVRLVFCLYAEDAGIFGDHLKFHNYMKRRGVSGARSALLELFSILDQRPEERDPYKDEDLLSFPYVNGSLFSGDIEIPRINEEIYELIIAKASEGFDWSEISPTIFGAVFESTLNPETRRSGGMHYTSIENIHKVIDPLFLNGLKAELESIKEMKVDKTRKQRLIEFQNKLASLKFLDPACGSGNFLTETYLSLRRLENEAIMLRHGDQLVFGMDESNPIKVSIAQFYGIEINDFAVTVAKTALWIAESQMMKQTEDIVHMNLEFLPLTTNANIAEGNALALDWESVVPKAELNYIMGNPPFVGYSLQTKQQKEDILSIYVDERGKPYKTAGKIDYVSGWYFKAAELMMGTGIRTALVSTNSITQGEQVAGIWKPLYDRFGIHIDFAHRTFRWDSEASIKAHVHCVIVGFSSAPNSGKKLLFSNDRVQEVENINAYLYDAPNVLIASNNSPICDVPPMRSGGKPVEGGNLIFTDDEKNAFILAEPKAEKFFRRFVGADDYINNITRWCLWLLDATPSELRAMPNVLKRVEAVRQFRLESVKAATREFAEQPTRFMEIKQPETDYLLIPATSSENRKYIPIGFLSKDVVASNAASFVSNATLYHFGVLTSNVHMAWMRAVCGRLEMRYRYSNNIVYNNFPWPSPTEEQKAKITETAQAILDARALYPDSSLADLYDELTMPPELRKAHQDNDRAVMRAYGFDIKTMTEPSCVAELMKMYLELTKK